MQDTGPAPHGCVWTCVDEAQVGEYSQDRSITEDVPTRRIIASTSKLKFLYPAERRVALTDLGEVQQRQGPLGQGNPVV